MTKTLTVQLETCTSILPSLALTVLELLTFNTHLTSQIYDLLKRCLKYGYCLEINNFEDLIESADCKLFKNYKIVSPVCILCSYLQLNHKNHNLRPKGHICPPDSKLLYRIT